MDIDLIAPLGVDGRPFSAAARSGGWVLPAGQAGERADGTVPESFAEEVALALDNLSAVLESAGATSPTSCGSK